MERSKLSLTQKQTSKSPSLEEGGGGGGIGKKIHNGGGGGGDDDDDDEYFEEGDGEDPDDTKWWHKVPLDKLYDAATVRAVLSVRLALSACMVCCNYFTRTHPSAGQSVSVYITMICSRCWDAFPSLPCRTND